MQSRQFWIFSLQAAPRRFWRNPTLIFLVLVFERVMERDWGPRGNRAGNFSCLQSFLLLDMHLQLTSINLTSWCWLCTAWYALLKFLWVQMISFTVRALSYSTCDVMSISVYFIFISIWTSKNKIHFQKILETHLTIFLIKQNKTNYWWIVTHKLGLSSHF